MEKIADIEFTGGLYVFKDVVKKIKSNPDLNIRDTSGSVVVVDNCETGTNPEVGSGGDGGTSVTTVEKNPDANITQIFLVVITGKNIDHSDVSERNSNEYIKFEAEIHNGIHLVNIQSLGIQLRR